MQIFTVSNEGSPDFSSVQAAINFIETIAGGRDQNYEIQLTATKNFQESVTMPVPIDDNDFWIRIVGTLAQDFSTGAIGKDKIVSLTGPDSSPASSFRVGGSTKIHILQFSFTQFSGVSSPDFVVDFNATGVENIIVSNSYLTM